jgi:hypothetical protein
MQGHEKGKECAVDSVILSINSYCVEAANCVTSLARLDIVSDCLA